MAIVLNCRFQLSKFKLQSHYYIHFQINTQEKVIIPFSPNYELNSTTAFLW